MCSPSKISSKLSSSSGSLSEGKQRKTPATPRKKEKILSPGGEGNKNKKKSAHNKTKADTKNNKRWHFLFFYYLFIYFSSDF